MAVTGVACPQGEWPPAVFYPLGTSRRKGDPVILNGKVHIFELPMKFRKNKNWIQHDGLFLPA
jgi:hypothetical protein